MAEDFTHVRVSLDVDNVSHGEDEIYTAHEVRRAGGLEALVDSYVAFYATRIIEIHGLDENETVENLRRYVAVSAWREE